MGSVIYLSGIAAIVAEGKESRKTFKKAIILAASFDGRTTTGYSTPILYRLIARHKWRSSAVKQLSIPTSSAKIS